MIQYKTGSELGSRRGEAIAFEEPDTNSVWQAVSWSVNWFLDHLIVHVVSGSPVPHRFHLRNPLQFSA